jgi:lipopolysaccharide export system protein LptA
MNKTKKIPYLFFILILIIITIQASQAVTVTIKADKQDFQVEQNTAQFEGNVKVNYGAITITSPKATLSANLKGEPDKATFSEGVSAIKTTKDSSDKMTADSLTLLLASNQMIARGNVRSDLKQGSPAAITIKANTQEFNNATNEIRATGNVVVTYKGMTFSAREAKLVTTTEGKPYKAELIGGARVVRSSGTVSAGQITYDINSNRITASGGVNTVANMSGAGRVSMSSDYQQYDQGNNVILGSGHVKVVYQDYIATGPKATIYTSGGANVDKIVFSGRAQIADNHRKVSADTITVSMNPKNFTAVGNVQTQFVQKGIPENSSQAIKEPTHAPQKISTPQPTAQPAATKSEPVKTLTPTEKEENVPEQTTEDDN